MTRFSFNKATAKTALLKAEYFIGNLPENKEYDIEIREHRNKRSLDANAYCWLLIGKIAAAVQVPKEDVYKKTIKDIGDNYEIFPIKAQAVTRWQEIWENKGLGWVTEIAGESKLEGYVNVLNYYGSSVYDTKQMSRLIDSVIQEAKALGIETETPEKIELYKQEWKK